MASLRRFIGRGTESPVWFRAVTRRSRLGTKVVLHQLKSVPNAQREEQMLQQAMAALAQKETLTPYKAQKLQAKMRVLQSSMELRKNQGGRNPTVYHLLAVEGLRYGLNSEQLTQFATRMASMWVGKRREATWEGNPMHLYEATRTKIPSTGKNIVASVDELLLREGEKRKPLSSIQIAEKLGLEFVQKNRKNQHLLNATFQLLEVAGLIKKMPEMVVPGHRSVSMWTSTHYANPRVDYPNPAIEILSAAHQGSTKLPGVYTDFTRGKRYGKQSGITATTIRTHLRRLVKGGLITVNTVRQGFTRVQVVTLTPVGRKLMDAYAREKSLPEVLRLIIIGERE